MTHPQSLQMNDMQYEVITKDCFWYGTTSAGCRSIQTPDCSVERAPTNLGARVLKKTNNFLVFLYSGKQSKEVKAIFVSNRPPALDTTELDERDLDMKRPDDKINVKYTDDSLTRRCWLGLEEPGRWSDKARRERCRWWWRRRWQATHVQVGRGQRAELSQSGRQLMTKRQWWLVPAASAGCSGWRTTDDIRVQLITASDTSNHRS